MSELRVAHVVCTKAFAGVERYVSGVAVAQAERGARVHVIGGDGRMRASVERAGAAWNAASTVPAAVRALRKAGPQDVIVTHMTAADIAGYLAARGTDTHIVSVRHFAAGRGRNPLARPLIRAAAAHITAEIAVSDAVAAHCAPHATVIRTGTVRVDDDGTPREPLALVAQRLEPEKSTDDAIRAWAIARPTGWRLAVAGDGSQRAHLGDLAADLGVADTVDFVGHRDDISSWMRRASVFVAPTPNEGLGLAVIEAMAHGLPVVAAASGGHLETVGAVDSPSMFEPHDAHGAASAIAALASDPQVRATYGERLRAFQRAFLDAPAQWDATHRVIGSVVTGALA